MFSKKDFSLEIENEMESKLISNAVDEENVPFHKFAKALDYLNSVAEIFDDLGLNKESELATTLMEVVAAKGKKKSKKSKTTSKKQAPKKKNKKTVQKKKSPSSSKQVKNLEEHGTVFDMNDARDELSDLGLSGDEELPEDYETCGECGFDHSYEPEEAMRVHLKMEKDDDENDIEDSPRHTVILPPPLEEEEVDEDGDEMGDLDLNLKPFRPDTKNWRDIEETARPTMPATPTAKNLSNLFELDEDF